MNFVNKTKKYFDKIMPFNLANVIILAVVAYLIFVVGKTAWDNYQSNQSLIKDEIGLSELNSQIKNMEYEIAYYNTKSYKEKQARSKLGYIAAGETAVSVPADAENSSQNINKEDNTPSYSIPNSFLWYDYFTK